MALNLSKQIENAAKKLADSVVAEMALEDSRHTVKLAAIERIMSAGDNKLTGKPHSFSSAEAVVHTDVDYADHLERMRNAVRDRILAKGAYDAALAEARLATLQETAVNV